ncbi:MAG: beta-N-acetylglucosaminidase domain-containing protein [Brevundimonas sp.]|nr:beta-N-acetylglucosaminidase domain-containing protein [Brevundimonas sp.]
MIPELGIIEGYFGRMWSWPDRAFVLRTLAAAGYGFFHYAPKGEARLRRGWRDPFDDAALRELAGFARLCRDLGVRFGIGLTPYEAHLDFGPAARRDLKAKLSQFRALGLDDLVILFDDMRGDVPDLARRQADIVSTCLAEAVSERSFVVPTYYSDDPILDRVFGARPRHYLRDLGRGLPPDVAAYWTGESVCSSAYSLAHLDRVSGELGRPVALWDNYPVNDGPRMSAYLHLRGFPATHAGLAGHVRHHAINPMLQPRLGLIPALTLPIVYKAGRGHDEGDALRDAAVQVLGEGLAGRLLSDLSILQDAGRGGAGPELSRLIDRYGDIDHPAAVEIVDWARGGYAMGDELVRTQ